MAALTLGSHRRAQCQCQLATCGGEVTVHLRADVAEDLQHEACGTRAALAAGVVRGVGHQLSLTGRAMRPER